MPKFKKILIINLGGIGDFLLSTPAIKALKEETDSALFLLSSPRIAQFAKKLSYIERVYTFYIGYGGAVSFSKIFENIRTLLKLRKKHFGLAINMRTLYSDKGAKKIKFLLDIINPKLKAGRDTEGRGYFFDIKIPETKIGQKYELEYDIDIVKALGIEVKDRSINFPISKEASEVVRSILEKEGVRKEDILIGLHPGGMPSRRWPVENFSQAIKEISKRIPFSKFVITGGRDETNLGEKLVEITDIKMINLVGKLNIEELGALIKRCSLYISNDTAPMHIAAVLKRPLIAIFGPGDITRFDPRNISDKAKVLYKKVDCAPCEKISCSDLRCLKGISPEEVANLVLHLLEQN
ncbi:MAG TPA: glycosyltransferase family 9 protein [Candidatus Atribacteria bacterium]|nr:glycosyltransferase family 9 protein [Candidatus Atribacteria bacterium]